MMLVVTVPPPVNDAGIESLSNTGPILSGLLAGFTATLLVFTLGVDVRSLHWGSVNTKATGQLVLAVTLCAFILSSELFVTARMRYAEGNRVARNHSIAGTIIYNGGHVLLLVSLALLLSAYSWPAFAVFALAALVETIVVTYVWAKRWPQPQGS